MGNNLVIMLMASLFIYGCDLLDTPDRLKDANQKMDRTVEILSGVQEQTDGTDAKIGLLFEFGRHGSASEFRLTYGDALKRPGPIKGKGINAAKFVHALEYQLFVGIETIDSKEDREHLIYDSVKEFLALFEELWQESNREKLIPDSSLKLEDYIANTRIDRDLAVMALAGKAHNVDTLQKRLIKKGFNDPRFLAFDEINIIKVIADAFIERAHSKKLSIDDLTLEDQKKYLDESLHTLTASDLILSSEWKPTVFNLLKTRADVFLGKLLRATVQGRPQFVIDKLTVKEDFSPLIRLAEGATKSVKILHFALAEVGERMDLYGPYKNELLTACQSSKNPQFDENTQYARFVLSEKLKALCAEVEKGGQILKAKK